MATVGRPQALPAPARRVTPAAAASAARRILGLASLVGLVWCAWAIVTGAAYRPTELVPARLGGFPLWLRGPLGDLGGFLPLTDFALYVLLMCGLFVVALLCAPALHPGWSIAAVVLLHLLFFLGPPLISADSVGYIDWARAGVLHGLNPYTTDSGTVVSDAVYPFVRWERFSSPYGPLFTLFTYAIVPLGVAGSFWALKLATLGASLGICAFIWAAARRLGRPPVPALILYGLNPAVLVYALAGVHNDVLMMLPLMGGLYLLVAGRERAGGALAAAAVGVKASAGLVIPFAVLGARRREGVLVPALAAGAAILALGLAVFGTQVIDFINVLGSQQELDSGTSVIAQLGAVFGWQGNPVGARVVAAIVFAAVLAYLLVRTWQRREDWLEHAGWATLALMACTSWLLAWYIVWLVPLAALSRRRWLPAAALGMTLFVTLTRIVPLMDG
jgi:Glycosyltransferase family 87